MYLSADYLYICPHKPLHTFDERYLHVPASESYRGFTDRHLVVSARHVVPALRVLPYMMEDGSLPFWVSSRRPRSKNMPLPISI